MRKDNLKFLCFGIKPSTNLAVSKSTAKVFSEILVSYNILVSSLERYLLDYLLTSAELLCLDREGIKGLSSRTHESLHSRGLQLERGGEVGGCHGEDRGGQREPLTADGGKVHARVGVTGVSSRDL